MLTHAHTDTQTDTQVPIETDTHTLAHRHTHRDTQTHTLMHIHRYIHTYIRTSTHTLVHTQWHTHIDTHWYTHRHRQMDRQTDTLISFFLLSLIPQTCFLSTSLLPLASPDLNLTPSVPESFNKVTTRPREGQGWGTWSMEGKEEGRAGVESRHKDFLVWPGILRCPLLHWNLCKHTLLWNDFTAQQGPGECQTVRLLRKKEGGGTFISAWVHCLGHQWCL